MIPFTFAGNPGTDGTFPGFSDDGASHDRSKLQNGVMEPLREADLID